MHEKRDGVYAMFFLPFEKIDSESRHKKSHFLGIAPKRKEKTRDHLQSNRGRFIDSV